MSKKRKPKALTPRRWRMNRQARLASARAWLEKFSGKNIVRSYAKWFAVDLLCATKELSLLGVAVDPAYVAQLEKTFASRRTQAKPPVQKSPPLGYGVDWDENFAYIAGRTEAGFPYGVTWKELAADETGDDDTSFVVEHDEFCEQPVDKIAVGEQFNSEIAMAAVTVKLSEVVEYMDLFSDEATSYINTKTGEMIMLTDEVVALVEDPESAADAPQWQKELLPKARKVLESGDFIALPGKFEIHEWSIMDRFAQSLTDSAMSDQLDAALHGRGAFRRFKDAVRRLGFEDEWYRFRETALEEIAIEFLEDHGIAYQREPARK